MYLPLSANADDIFASFSLNVYNMYEFLWKVTYGHQSCKKS